MELIILTIICLIEQLMEWLIGLRETQLWCQLDGSNFQVTVPRYNNISSVLYAHHPFMYNATSPIVRVPGSESQGKVMGGVPPLSLQVFHKQNVCFSSPIVPKKIMLLPGNITIISLN